MKNKWMRDSVLVLYFILTFMTFDNLFAVRPFVTDDARISDYGQLEFELWPDFVRDSQGDQFGFNMMFGVSFTDYLQIITGSGVGYRPKENSTHSHHWVVQPKLLLFEARENGIPGLALVAGTVLPLNQADMFRRDTGYFWTGVITQRLLDDWLLLHGNLGMVGSTAGQAEAYRKFYWGVGLDLGVWKEEIRLIAEAFAGDPYEIIGPTLAYQIGSRYLYSDHVNLDFTYGWQKEVDNRRQETGATSWWAQVGIRLLFDVFTHDGKPGNPMGAPGLFR